MHYVYIIESVSVPGHFYIGYTEELRERIRKHQADVSSHAAKFRPWKLKVYFAFESKETAMRFERYLKSGSGRAFCKRHFELGFYEKFWNPNVGCHEHGHSAIFLAVTQE